MIEIKTLLVVGRQLVPIESATEPPPDPAYVGGAIDLRIDGVRLLSDNDLVDQLWAYLVDAAIDIAAGKDVSFRYPDQALRVTFTIHHRRDTVTMEVFPPDRVDRATAPRAELVRAIGEHAEAAFVHLERLLPGAYGHELRLARQLLQSQASRGKLPR